MMKMSENITNTTLDINSSVHCDTGELLASEPLLHVSCFLLLISYLLPSHLLWARITYHSGLVTGHMIMTMITWTSVCTRQMMFWHAGFIIINITQIISVLYISRENKFEPDIETVYQNLFLPFSITR